MERRACKKRTEGGDEQVGEPVAEAWAGEVHRG